jgi:hypothetical protein
VQLGDKITSIKVLKGQENLVLPDSGPIISVPSSSSEAPEQASE